MIRFDVKEMALLTQRTMGVSELIGDGDEPRFRLSEGGTVDRRDSAGREQPNIGVVGHGR